LLSGNDVSKWNGFYRPAFNFPSDQFDRPHVGGEGMFTMSDLHDS